MGRRRENEAAVGCGCLIGIVILLLMWKIIVAGIGIILCSAIAIAAAIGAAYGIGLSSYYFLLAIRENLFVRTNNIEDDAYINYFDFHGDGFRNVWKTCSQAVSKTFSGAKEWIQYSSPGCFMSIMWVIFNCSKLAIVFIVAAICFTASLFDP